MFMSTSEMIFDDHEIIPLTGGAKFGVILTDEEAGELRNSGFRIKTTTPENGAEAMYYLEVFTGSHRQEAAGVQTAVTEWAGRGDVVVSPQPWGSGIRSGMKASFKSVKGHVRHYCVRENPSQPAHTGDHVCSCGRTWAWEDRK